MPTKRQVRKSTDTYCALHQMEFTGSCPACDELPTPDELNTGSTEYVFDATDIDWLTCPCGALRVLPITDECPLCGRDTPYISKTR